MLLLERSRLLAAELERNSARPLQDPSVIGRHDPGAVAATFATDAWLDVAPVDLLALIREADLGPLAGRLSRWEPRSIEAGSPWTQRVLYVSDLPWPFRPRVFCIESRVTLRDGGVVRIESASAEPDAGERARVSGAAWGTVVFSGYNTTPARGGARLQRVIEVNLGMRWPRRAEVALLSRVYAHNHAWLAGGRKHATAREFVARKERDPVYAAVMSHTRDVA